MSPGDDEGGGDKQLLVFSRNGMVLIEICRMLLNLFFTSLSFSFLSFLSLLLPAPSFSSHSLYPAVSIFSLLYRTSHFKHFICLGCVGSWLQPSDSLLHCVTFSLVVVCGIFVPWPGMELLSPALEGELLTTGPPGTPNN